MQAGRKPGLHSFFAIYRFWHNGCGQTMIDVAHIDATRKEELQRVLDRQSNLFAGKDLLEIGSGTGVQLKRLANICRSAVGIEVADSFYTPHRVAEIQQYDGSNIPFPDRSFDIVFSSHVLEHIKDEETVHREMQRVLRAGGVGVHVVPTHTWRIWNSVVHYPALPGYVMERLRQHSNGQSPSVGAQSAKRRWGVRVLNLLTPPRHGEFGNRISEHWLFHPAFWRRRLEAFGWRVETIETLGLAYTGHSFFGPRVSMRTRARWSRIFGSSTILIVLRHG
jgi:SAM-dependent methyltransferase